MFRVFLGESCGLLLNPKETKTGELFIQYQIVIIIIFFSSTCVLLRNAFLSLFIFHMECYRRRLELGVRGIYSSRMCLDDAYRLPYSNCVVVAVHVNDFSLEWTVQ